MIRPGTRYSLCDNDAATGRSRLAREGRPTAVVVEGVVLEAQFDLGHDESLVLLTDDCPFEEGLHIYLLGAGGDVEDAVEAGAMYTPGILEILAVDEAALDLRFFTNDLRYRVAVMARRQLRFSLPRGWRYKRRLGRHRLVVWPG